MKSNKLFFLLIISMLFLLWCFDIALGTNSVKTFSGYEKVIIAIFGLLILKLTLDTYNFKIFCFLYGAIWLGFIILKIISFLVPVLLISNHNIITMNLVKYYLGITFLNTPLPIILYWLFVKNINKRINSK